MLVLDGRTGEGGGQILRTALFLSLLTKRPFRVDHIRAGRPKPGLKPQHVGILRVLSQATDSRVRGSVAGSSAIEFDPGEVKAARFAYEVGTAGSIPLFLQTLLPVAFLSPGRFTLELRGGTDVPFSPTIDWVEGAYLARIASLGHVRLDVLRRGFAPHGGGHVRLEVDGHGAQLPDEVGRRLAQPGLARGENLKVDVRSLAQTPMAARRVAERQAEAVRSHLPADWPASVSCSYVDTAGPGTSVTALARDDLGNRWGADGLGRRGVTAESVGEGVAARLLDDLRNEATVDRHLADHLVPLVALGMGPVRVPEITAHLSTNLWTCQQFLGADCVRLAKNVLQGPA